MNNEELTRINSNLVDDDRPTSLNASLADGDRPTSLNANLSFDNPTSLNANLVADDRPTSLNANIDDRPTSLNAGLVDSDTPTNLNAGLADGPTSVNRNIDNEDPTSLNRNIQLGQTVATQSLLKPGRVVKSYRIIKLLSKSGEAEVYHCEKDGEEFVLKIYLKDISFKREVQELLVGKKLSPYLAYMVEVDELSINTDSGSTLRYTYEVEPFYNPLDSILTYREIKKLIHDINEGLHVIHTLDETIIHKDIKPSNIMKDNDGNYLLIDFGISSIIGKDMTSLKTSTGLTFDYAAPESRISNRFSKATDYYSFGISLYHMFTGELPYADSSERLDLLMRRGIIIPDEIGMPKDLATLIQGLTFYNSDPDINRKRWGYEEVKRWLEGDTSLEAPRFQNIVQEPVNYQDEDRMPPYIFKKVTYTSRLEFVKALGENWEDGKKALFHGLITEHYKKIGNQTLIQYCMDAEDEQGSGNDDLVFYRFLYQVEPRLDKIYWKGQVFSEAEFAKSMILEPMWRCNGIYDSSTTSANFKEIKETQMLKLLSIYYGRNDTNNPYYKLAREFEACQGKYSRDAIYIYYSMAYQMLGMKLFRLYDKIFGSIEELADFTKEVLDRDINEYFKICDTLYGNDVQTDFYCWMKSLGLEDRVSQLAL